MPTHAPRVPGWMLVGCEQELSAAGSGLQHGFWIGCSRVSTPGEAERTFRGDNRCAQN